MNKIFSLSLLSLFILSASAEAKVNFTHLECKTLGSSQPNFQIIANQDKIQIISRDYGETILSLVPGLSRAARNGYDAVEGKYTLPVALCQPKKDHWEFNCESTLTGVLKINGIFDADKPARGNNIDSYEVAIKSISIQSKRTAESDRRLAVKVKVETIDGKKADIGISRMTTQQGLGGGEGSEWIDCSIKGTPIEMPTIED